jgi:PAS domain S-box-containing protein
MPSWQKQSEPRNNYKRMNRTDHIPMADEGIKVLIDTIPLAAGWIDMNWTCRYVNSRFVALFGYTQDDVKQVGEMFSHVISNSGDWHEKLIASSNNTIVPSSLNSSIVCTSGTIKHVVINAQVVGNRIIATFTDITELETSNKNLIESEEMFRLSFDRTKDAIFWANVQTGILVNCNQAAEELLEMPRNEIIGKHQSFLHPPEMRDHFISLFKNNVINECSVHDSEAIVFTSSGKRIPVHIKHSVTRICNIDVVQGIFRDISGQKHTDKTLRDAHILLQKTLDSLNEAVFIVETGTRIILDVNAAVGKMFGYTRQEIVGKTTSCLHINDEMSYRFAKEMLKAYEENGYYETLFHMRRHDGTCFDSEHFVTPIRDEQGRILRHVCVVRDISERVRAQDEQRNIVLEQGAILDNSCVGITLTRDRKIVWTNNKFDEMFDYDKGELHGRSVRTVYPSDEAYELSGKATYASVSKGILYESELILVRKDGSEFWAKYYGKAIDPSNLSAGTIWIVEDISSRKYMEQTLTDKTRQLKELNNCLEKRVSQAVQTLKLKDDLLINQTRLLVELAPDAILVVNDELGKIIDANAHAEKLFGCSKQVLFETSPLSFYKSEQPDGVSPDRSFYQNSLRVLDGEALVIERVIVPRDGGERFCEVRLVRMPFEGRYVIRASFIDITERKMIEMELAKALDTAKTALEEQKQFIGLISHELRTPLAIIDGAAQLLILTACADSTCLSHSERIRSATRRIIDLVDTCLTEVRIASSGWEPEFFVERIYQLMHDVAEKVQAGTEKHRIDLDISNLPSHCSCDAALIKVMLINLLDNAVKYSPQGGVITLRGWCNAPGYVSIQVSDQGIGFDPELSDKIFERFYRTWQVPGIPGAGLGLYLVKKISELHNGGVAASSQLGQGASFTVWIRSDS